MSAMNFVLTPHFARTIITQVMSLLGRDVSLADKGGKLVASYDPNLVGKQLSGVEAVLEGKDVAVLADSQAVGIPISHDDTLAGVLIIHSDPKTVKEFVPITRSLVDLLVSQEAEQALAGNLDQVLWQLFHSLSDAERDKLISEAKLLGVDLTKPRFVALVTVPGFSATLAEATDKSEPINRFKEKLGREVAAMFPTSSDNTITYFGQDTFLILKDAAKGDETLDIYRQKSDQMLSNLGRGLSAGIGGLYLGVEGLLTSFKEAETALRLGTKLNEPGRTYYIDDLGLYIVFGGVSADKQVHAAKKILAPLLNDPDLLKTIRGYFAENLNLTKAAEALHIHRNTLIYRLGKIKELLKLDPETFEDAVQIKLALTLLELE